jgi:tetratricopeptide (TPR) repeat protein
VDLLYEQAMIDERMNHMDDMEQLLRKIVTLKPDYEHALNALGYSLADRNIRLDEALKLVQKAAALSPGDPFITDSLGWVEYRLGNRDEALKLLRQAHAARPDTEISAHLGEVLWVNGLRDEALRVWRDGQARDAHNEVLQETLARLKVSL